MLTDNHISTKSQSRTWRKVTKGLIPFAYLAPTIILLTILSLIPIVMVFNYSLMNNVIMEKKPVFVGTANYVKLLKDKAFQQAILNTLYFTVMSVVFHLILGMTFAMLLNTKIISPTIRALFRVVYVLPWVFTATIIAVLWRVMLNPNGIINYIIVSAGLFDGKIEWLTSKFLALHVVTFINIWAGYPFYMVSLLAGLQGIPDQLYEAALDWLGAHRGFDYTVEEISNGIGACDKVETLFKVCEHLAGNPDRRVRRVGGASPFTARYGMV